MKRQLSCLCFMRAAVWEAGMSLRKLAEYTKGAIPEDMLDVLNSELRKIDLDMEDGEGEMMERLKNKPLTKEAAEQISVGEQTAVYPGRPSPYSEVRKHREICLLDQAFRRGSLFCDSAGRYIPGTV